MSDSDSYTLLKILEREVQSLKTEIDRLYSKSSNQKDFDLQVALLQNKVSEIEKDLEELREAQISNFVPFNRYAPVEKIVFGMVGLILVSFIGALVGLVIRT